MATARDGATGEEITVTACSICDRPIPPEAQYPLCPRCLGTAEAVGRQEAHVRRYPLDHHDRRFA